MATQSEEVEISLSVPVRVNGKNFSKGKHKVPREQADDIKRIESDHLQYKASLIEDNGHQIDAGTVVGGGE